MTDGECGRTCTVRASARARAHYPYSTALSRRLGGADRRRRWCLQHERGDLEPTGSVAAATTEQHLVPSGGTRVITLNILYDGRVRSFVRSAAAAAGCAMVVDRTRSFRRRPARA